MKKSKHPRFAVVAVVAITGTIMSGAVALGHTWGDALIAEIVTVVISAGYYLLSGSDSDVGALYGQRADERQKMVLLKAARLSTLTMLLVAFVGAAITVALNDNYWQFDLVGSIGGVTYLLGMLAYGTHVEDESVEHDVMN